MLDLKLIGNRIRTLRQEKNLTQSEFASALMVSFQAVSNWERGIAPPELENLTRIATYFNVLVDDLLRPENETLYLGIDGGGTKTEFALVQPNGTVLKRITKQGCNPNDIGFDKTKSILIEGIQEILLQFASIKGIFCGIAGAGSNHYDEKLSSALKQKFPKINIDVKTDSFNLFYSNDDADMVVISGTGSVVFVKDNENYIRLGGWGHLLDNGGSAYDIGKAALQLALHEEDSKLPPSNLTKKLYQELNISSVWEHISKIYTEGKPYIASLAKIVFNAYRNGDKNALEIIDNNAKALAELLNKGVHLYGANNFALANGGLFEHNREIMIEHIKKYSSVNLIFSELPPIYGACRKACTMVEGKLCNSYHENFIKTYGAQK